MKYDYCTELQYRQEANEWLARRLLKWWLIIVLALAMVA